MRKRNRPMGDKILRFLTERASKTFDANVSDSQARVRRERLRRMIHRNLFESR